jgi:hypothetical protein
MCKKYVFIYLSTLLIMLCSCCNHNQNNIIQNELVNDVIVPSSINNAGSIEKYNSEELMSRIENIEKEINQIKNTTIINEKNKNTYGLIINAIENSQGDDIFLDMTWDGHFLSEVFIKTKKVENISYNFYILIGEETDGVLFFDKFLKPQYDKVFNYQDYGLDNKTEIYKLMTSKIDYDKNSIMMLIMIDSSGEEYSQLVYSQLFEEDI